MQIGRGPGDKLSYMRGEALPFEIELQGIEAAKLARLFKGQSVGDRWADARTVYVAATSPETPAAGEPFMHRFADGTTFLRSGSVARIAVETPSLAPEHLLPPALNLALAQQWARLGLMALHAAAIKVGDRQILVLGPKASGKSTMCLAVLVAQAEILSDDWLLLGQGADEGIACERLREFLMVRDCWASDQLRLRQPDLGFQRSGARPKQVLPVQAQTEHFPPSLAINEIWVMTRGRGGRTAESGKQPENATQVLVHLIKAAMPLLFSARFPLEHAALMKTAQALIQSCPAYRVQSGTDLVEQPERTLARLTGG